MDRKAVTILMTIQTLCLCGLIAPSHSEDRQGESSVFEETEFCNSETFKPECAEDEAIVIMSAQYGRFEIGRCVAQNFGYLGCVNDVIPDVDTLCGGRQTCEVLISDTTFPGIRPCHKDLKSHLRVAYKCLKVTIPRSRCQYTEGVPLTEAEGYLSSRITENTGCGSTEHPWIIQAPSGQHVNITLMDFSFNHSQSLLDGQSIPRVCKVYATIRETSAMRSTTVCGSQGREVNVYVSTKNVVEVRVLANSASPVKPQFLLHYKVIGCPDPEIPDGAWLKRDGKTALLGCEDESRWELTCHGQKWAGTAGICSTAQSAFLANVVQSVKSLPYGISIVLIIAIAVTVSCLILVIGVVCIKTRMKRGQRQSANGDLPSNAETYPHQKYDTSQTLPPGGYPPDANASMRENEYASMRLLRPGALYDRENPIENGQEFASITTSYRRGMYTPSEHIYESPETIRRDLADQGSPQYFDIDPQVLPVRSQTSNQSTCSHDNYCTCATGQRNDPSSRGQVANVTSKPRVPSYNGNLSV